MSILKIKKETPPSLCYQHVSFLPCTEDATLCIIKWDLKLITIDACNDYCTYPFHQCSIKLLLNERIKSNPSLYFRRARLSISTFPYPSYILAPNNFDYDERVLSALGIQLFLENKNNDMHVDDIQPINLGPGTVKFSNYFLIQNITLQPHSNLLVQCDQFNRECHSRWMNTPYSTLKHYKTGTSWITHDEQLLNSTQIIQKCDSFMMEDSVKNTCTQLVPNTSNIDHYNRYSSHSNRNNQLNKFQQNGAIQLEKYIVQPLIKITKMTIDFLYYLNTLHHQVYYIGDNPQQIYGAYVDWSEEPVLPIQLFLIRHGQQQLNSVCPACCHTQLSADVDLSILGKMQSIRTSELLYKLTGGFIGSHQSGVWSSHLKRSSHTADIIWKAMKCLGGDLASFISCRIQHENLREYIPSYPYTISSTLLTDEQRRLQNELLKNQTSLEEMYWLISAALRSFFGPLCPVVHSSRISQQQNFFMWDAFEFSNYSVMQQMRFPPLALPESFSNSPICKHSSLQRSINFILSGHGNCIKHYIIKELGFPENLWKHIQIPHCSVFLIGYHYTGVPALLIGDSGYLICPPRSSSADSLSLTFTAVIEQHTQSSIQQNEKSFLDSDPLIDLMSIDNESLSIGMAGHEHIHFKTLLECHKQEKHILLLRAGQNKVANWKDQGLTILGENQLKLASIWLREFLISAQIINPPTCWCISQLSTTQLEIQKSLTQSVQIVKNYLLNNLGEAIYQPSLIESKEDLTPESIFAAPTRNGDLFVIVADDYQLMRYVAACFGINPISLRRALWPHAGFVLISVAEQAWPELRVFGTISHLDPSQISILPAVSTFTSSSSSSHGHSDEKIHSSEKKQATQKDIQDTYSETIVSEGERNENNELERELEERENDIVRKISSKIEGEAEGELKHQKSEKFANDGTNKVVIDVESKSGSEETDNIESDVERKTGNGKANDINSDATTESANETPNKLLSGVESKSGSEKKDNEGSDVKRKTGSGKENEIKSDVATESANETANKLLSGVESKSGSEKTDNIESDVQRKTGSEKSNKIERDIQSSSESE